MEVLDKEIGSRIRILRCIRHMTQKELARKMSISFQQLQKNEKGDSKITCSRLLKIATILKVDVSHFLENLTGAKDNQKAAFEQKSKDSATVLGRDEIKLLAEYGRIKDHNLLRAIRYIIAKIASYDSKDKQPS